MDNILLVCIFFTFLLSVSMFTRHIVINMKCTSKKSSSALTLRTPNVILHANQMDKGDCEVKGHISRDVNENYGFKKCVNGNNEYTFDIVAPQMSNTGLSCSEVVNNMIHTLDPTVNVNDIKVKEIHPKWITVVDNSSKC